MLINNDWKYIIKDKCVDFDKGRDPTAIDLHAIVFTDDSSSF